MSNALVALIRNSNKLCSQVLLIQSQPVLLKSQAIRNLYSKITLGIDSYLEQKQRTLNQLVNILPKFKGKMNEYTSENTNSMIFTEDLKNMLHIAENDDDVQLVIKMLKKFNQQNQQLRFGNYIFGPVIMRMFHVLNKPDEALQCFTAPELAGLFDQLVTYQIFLDLLYENGKYHEVIDCFKIIQERQIEGIKFAKNAIVLTFAACYKLNSNELMDYALSMWNELINVAHVPMRRATTFLAAFALKQGKPDVALEILSSAKNLNYTTVRNLRVLALTSLGRLEDAVIAVKSILNNDHPNGTTQTYNKEVIDQLKEAVEKSGTTEIKAEFNRVEKYLRQQGQISETTLDEQLCQEINPPRTSKNMSRTEFSRWPRSRFQRDEDNYANNRRERPFHNQLRPGLTDLQ